MLDDEPMNHYFFYSEKQERTWKMLMWEPPMPYRKTFINGKQYSDWEYTPDGCTWDDAILVESFENKTNIEISQFIKII